MNKTSLTAFGLLMGLIASAALADITYDGTDTVTVLTYPATNPATLADLRAANDNGAWGIVQYNTENDTTTLDSHLVIGAANGADSYLQIGRTNALTECLVLNGNLTVKTPSSSKRNGLLLGTDQTNTVRPVLNFDCTNNLQYSLTTEASTILASYNAVIGSTTTNRWLAKCSNNNIGEIFFTNSVFRDSYFYIFQNVHSVVANCMFAGGNCAIYNVDGFFDQCTFSNLDIALNDGGSLSCTVIGCTFTNNGVNWRLPYTSLGIRAIDCFIGKPRDTNIVCQRWWNTSKGWYQYPAFLAQRHIVVVVKNGSGNPIPNATVTVSNEQQEAGAVIHGLAVTGADGQTPAINSGQALFLTDYTYEASDNDLAPTNKLYTYTITATAAGYQTNAVTGVDPGESWTTQEIVLVASP